MHPWALPQGVYATVTRVCVCVCLRYFVLSQQICVCYFVLSYRYWEIVTVTGPGFLESGPRSTHPRNGSPTFHLPPFLLSFPFPPLLFPPFFFLCLFVVIKPENPYFASCPGLEVKSLEIYPLGPRSSSCDLCVCCFVLWLNFMYG